MNPILDNPSHGANLSAFLLGVIDYDDCLALQQRLVYEAGEERAGGASLLICEHPELITIGRAGSRGHIDMAPRQLESRGWDVRWVNRGGGCMLHAPGQLAIYPIVPLARRGWNVGEFLTRFQTGLKATMDELQVPAVERPGQFGLWGRSGQLLHMGVAVKNWVTYHGAVLNVSAPLHLFHSIRTDPFTRTPTGSLVAERQRPPRVSTLREALVRRLAEAFDCPKYHWSGGHPLLRQIGRRTVAQNLHVG